MNNRTRTKLKFVAVLIAFACFIAWGLQSLRPGPRHTVRIVENLKQLYAAKQMWASDNGATGSVQVSEQDLAPYFQSPYGGARPLYSNVAGEVYTVNPIGVSPEARLTRKLSRFFPEGAVIRLGPGGHGFEILPPKQGGANGRQPFSSETNRTSSAAASRRSP